MIRHRVLTVKNVSNQNITCLSVNNSMFKQNALSTEKQFLNSSLANIAISKSTPKNTTNQFINRVVKPRYLRNNSINETNNSKSRILCDESQSKSKSRTYSKIHKNETKENTNKPKQQDELYSKQKQLQQIKWLEKIVDSFGKYEMQVNGQEEEYIRNCNTELFQNGEKGKFAIHKKQDDRKPKYDNIKILQRKCNKKECRIQNQGILSKRQNRSAIVSKNRKDEQELQTTKKNQKSSKQKQVHNKSQVKCPKQVPKNNVKTNNTRKVSKNTTNLRNGRCSQSLQNISEIQKSVQIQLVTENKQKNVTKRQCNSRAMISKIQIVNNANKIKSQKKYLVVKESIQIVQKNLQNQQQKSQAKQLKATQDQSGKRLRAKSVGKIKKNKPQIYHKKRVVTECQNIIEQQNESKTKEIKFNQKQQAHEAKGKYSKYNYGVNLNQTDQTSHIPQDKTKNRFQNQRNAAERQESLQQKKYVSVLNSKQYNNSLSYVPYNFSNETNSYSHQKICEKQRKYSDYQNRTCKFTNEQMFNSTSVRKQQKKVNLSSTLNDKSIKRYSVQAMSYNTDKQINKRERTISDVEIEQILERTNTLKGQLNRLTHEYKKDKLFLQQCNVKNPISKLQRPQNEMNLIKNDSTNPTKKYSMNQKDSINSLAYKKKDNNQIAIDSNKDYSNYRKKQCALVQIFNKLDQDGLQVLSKYNCNINALSQIDRMRFAPLVHHIRETNKRINLAKFVKQCQFLDQQNDTYRSQLECTQKDSQPRKHQKNIKLEHFSQQCVQPLISPHFNQQLKHTISLQPSNISTFQQSKYQSIVQDKYSMETKSRQIDESMQNTRFLNSLSQISSNKYSQSVSKKTHDFKKKHYLSTECSTLVPGLSGILRQVQVFKQKLDQQERKQNLYAQKDEINKIEILNKKLERYINKMSSSKELRSQQTSYQFN